MPTWRPARRICKESVSITIPKRQKSNKDKWHEHSLSFAAIENELAIGPYSQGAHEHDAHTGVVRVRVCEHHDMSSSDDDDYWGHVDVEPILPYEDRVWVLRRQPVGYIR